MVFRSNALRGTRRTVKKTFRKRGVNTARVRYQPPKARFQKKQILSNAYAINRLASRVN